MMTELYLSKDEYDKLIVGESIKILVINDERPKVVANLNMSPAIRNDILEAIKNTNLLLEQINTSLEVDNYIKIEKEKQDD